MQYGLEFEEHIVKINDDLQLGGWFFPVENPSGVIVLVHGYTNDIGGKSQYIDHVQYLSDAGFAVFLLDMRCFGESGGEKTTLGINESQDLSIVFDYVAEIVDAETPIGFMGHSMGAATVLITMGETGKGDFAILWAPYAKYQNLFKAQLVAMGFPKMIYPVLDFIMRIELGGSYHTYDPLNYAQKITTPVFVIEGRKDQVIQSGDPKEIYNQLSGTKEYWLAEASHSVHYDLPEEFQDQVVAFLSNYVK